MGDILSSSSNYVIVMSSILLVLLNWFIGTRNRRTDYQRDIQKLYLEYRVNHINNTLQELQKYIDEMDKLSRQDEENDQDMNIVLNHLTDCVNILLKVKPFIEKKTLDQIVEVSREIETLAVKEHTIDSAKIYKLSTNLHTVSELLIRELVPEDYLKTERKKTYWAKVIFLNIFVATIVNGLFIIFNSL